MKAHDRKKQWGGRGGTRARVTRSHRKKKCPQNGASLLPYRIVLSLLLPTVSGRMVRFEAVFHVYRIPPHRIYFSVFSLVTRATVGGGTPFTPFWICFFCVGSGSLARVTPLFL